MHESHEHSSCPQPPAPVSVEEGIAEQVCHVVSLEPLKGRVPKPSAEVAGQVQTLDGVNEARGAVEQDAP